VPSRVPGGDPYGNKQREEPMISKLIRFAALKKMFDAFRGRSRRRRAY
jgi:hypothetical protein